MRQSRIIYKDNTTLVDLTRALADYYTESYTFADFVAAEDNIYIGNIAPFNHFYVKMDTASAASTTMTIQYWNGNGWKDVAETIDETDGLKESNFVYFVPDRNYGWVSSDTSGRGQEISDLNSVVIYDKYWIKIAFDNDLTDNCVIKWIGQKFSDDNDLGTEFPDLVITSALTSFKTGKTDWEEQHVRAAEIVIKDLITKNIIFSKDQILDKDSFTLPSVAKVAEIIYRSFGDNYLDQVKEAMQLYTERMNKSIYDVDLNGDGELTTGEMGARQGFMSR